MQDHGTVFKPKSRIAAVILAGGRGERLGGVIKANVVVGGLRLLERASAALGPTPSPVLVALGAFAPSELRLSPGQIPVSDLPSDYGGPLAGLAAAVDWCNRMPAPPALLASVAVDTPLLPDDFIERLDEALHPSSAVTVVRYAAQAYPTNAMWRLVAIRDLPTRLLAGTAPRSLRRLAESLGANYLDWPGSALAADPFASVNTPADLAALDRRARGGN